MVHLFVLFLLVMGLLCFIHPPAIKEFFDLFASSRRAHLIEQLIRLVVGLCLAQFSIIMNYGWIFQAFGWLIVLTSLILIVLPWQWHHQFAQYVIPYVKSHLKLYAVLSVLLAVLLLYGSWGPDDWMY